MLGHKQDLGLLKASDAMRGALDLFALSFHLTGGGHKGIREMELS
jgi:hypothetical protein